MKKATPDTPIETRVARFLFQYRSTPHSTTGISPAELLLGRRPHTDLDQLRPDLGCTVRKQQEQQKTTHDQRLKARSFIIGESVWVKNFSEVFFQTKGPLTMEIELEHGRIMRRHIDHIRSCKETDSYEKETDTDFMFVPPQDISEKPQMPLGPEAANNSLPMPANVDSDPPQTVRRSYRVRHPPDRLQVWN